VNSHEQVLKILLKEGADINMKDEDGHTAWTLAWKRGLKTAQELLMTPEQRLKLSEEMRLIIMAKDLTSLRRMLDEGQDVNTRFIMDHTPLHAVTLGPRDSKSPEMAKLLLDRGPDVNARDIMGRTPLHYAVGFKDHATVEVLLEGGADVNAKNNQGTTPLDQARVVKDYATMEVLGYPAGRQQGGRGEVSYP
jgi:ankyrin repeat protein